LIALPPKSSGKVTDFCFTFELALCNEMVQFLQFVKCHCNVINNETLTVSFVTFCELLQYI